MNMGRRRDLVKAARCFILLSLFALAVNWTIPARATEGDVFAKGTKYNALTYINHSEYGTHPSYSAYANSPEKVVDINIGSGSQDEGISLYAPEDGTVKEIYNNTDAWGYAIEWSNSSGSEKLFLAHLKVITKTGDVDGGEKIGELGGTGGWTPHLHIESSTGWLELSGVKIDPPVNPSGNGDLYTSKGPVKKFFHIEESDFFRSVKLDWYPANKSCVDAEIWMYNQTCDISIDKNICQNVYDQLVKFDWKYFSRDWKDIFFGDKDITKIIKKVGSCKENNTDKNGIVCYY